MLGSITAIIINIIDHSAYKNRQSLALVYKCSQSLIFLSDLFFGDQILSSCLHENNKRIYFKKSPHMKRLYLLAVSQQQAKRLRKSSQSKDWGEPHRTAGPSAVLCIPWEHFVMEKMELVGVPYQEVMCHRVKLIVFIYIISSYLFIFLMV